VLQANTLLLLPVDVLCHHLGVGDGTDRPGKLTAADAQQLVKAVEDQASMSADASLLQVS
jgi:hypothetical protein